MYNQTTWKKGVKVKFNIQTETSTYNDRINTMQTRCIQYLKKKDMGGKYAANEVCIVDLNKLSAK